MVGIRALVGTKWKRNWKKMLLIIPPILAVILFSAKTLVGILEKGKFDVIDFYLGRNLDFSMAFGLLLVGYTIAIYQSFSGQERKISGKWEIQFRPTNWKGEKNPRVIGEGAMYLTKSFFSDVNFSGYMYVSYYEAGKTLIHVGIYEIRLTFRRNRISGQSLMKWGQRIKEYPYLVSPGEPEINPCKYDLTYLEEENELVGVAKMTLGSDESEFRGFRP